MLEILHLSFKIKTDRKNFKRVPINIKDIFLKQYVVRLQNEVKTNFIQESPNWGPKKIVQNISFISTAFHLRPIVDSKQLTSSIF